jgi:hypothetical protein
MASASATTRAVYFKVIEDVISSLKDELELAGADTAFLQDLKRVFIINILLPTMVGGDKYFLWMPVSRFCCCRVPIFPLVTFESDGAYMGI